MKILVPCCGRSSRFPGMPPKWSLPAADGKSMLAHAVSGLGADPRDIVVTIRADHDRQLNARAGIKSALGRGVEIVVLENPTASAPETVAETLRRLRLDEPFLVKDCDNAFRLSALVRPFNYVATASLEDWPSVAAHNKSYVQTDADGAIRAIREKDAISGLFCTGGYYFCEPQAFLEAFDALSSAPSHARELYVSDIIARLILNDVTFRAEPVTAYEDWGTIDAWRAALSRGKTSEIHE